MNYRLVAKMLGIVALLIGGAMIFSLPWAFPLFWYRWSLAVPEKFELGGFMALVISIALSGILGAALLLIGKTANGRMYRKEAMAVVGLSWVLATILGGLPFYFCGVKYSPCVRLSGVVEGDSLGEATGGIKPMVYNRGYGRWRLWNSQKQLNADEYRVLNTLLEAGAAGLSTSELSKKSDVEDPAAVIKTLKDANEDWQYALVAPGERAAPDDRKNHYRIEWISMGISDSLFESQSGFSTTGATIISDLEDPVLVPHCILFWRSSTHFLGGLGIIVLFVVILGQGSAGKALMRAEMPGPSKEAATPRMRETAIIFTVIYCVLNVSLALILCIWMSPFDALCHAFGTMATGGFSNYNASLGHFDSVWVEGIVTFYMILAGTNFILLYCVVIRQPGKLFGDTEWRTYLAVIAGVTLVIIIFGLRFDDFKENEKTTILQEIGYAVRYGLFQVVSIITTTGYGTHDFDQWNNCGRGMLFLLMFVGGCAGSTAGGMKMIRHMLFVKILGREVERSYRPRVVRQLFLGGAPVDDPDLPRNILVYFGLIIFIFLLSWLFIVTFEPDLTWGDSPQHKLIDSASSVAATLNNIGPGLGTVGATQNYGHFSPVVKFLFVWLMMIGRLEIFSILVLVMPGFWRNR